MRNWLLSLGALSLIFAVVVSGFGDAGNPKSASSLFDAFAIAGMPRWAVMPLIAASFALFVGGAIAHGLARHEQGEV